MLDQTNYIEAQNHGEFWGPSEWSDFETTRDVYEPVSDKNNNDEVIVEINCNFRASIMQTIGIRLQISTR